MKSPAANPATPAASANPAVSVNPAVTATAPKRAGEADQMAVASFVVGLLGLLLFNIVLGPLSLVLGGLALARGTARRGRALLGLALGAADLVVLAVTVAAGHGALWQIG